MNADGGARCGEWVKMGYAQAEMGYAQAEMGYAQAEMGCAQAEMGCAQVERMRMCTALNWVGAAMVAGQR
ncbi:hypothetical protein CIK92_04640 [Prevotella sp. P4-67]|nr:hypothetical protein CIK92_04640 [Prevotella sp. P4-67]